MFSNVTSLTGLSSWARSGAWIALLVTGTILLTRLATWTGARITDRIDASAKETYTILRARVTAGLRREGIRLPADLEPAQPTEAA